MVPAERPPPRWHRSSVGPLLPAALTSTRFFEPLGMTETGFAFPADTDERRTTYYRHGDDGLIAKDGPDGQWATVPAFASGAGGLVSTLDDALAFQRMLLNRGGDLLPGIS